MEAQSNFYSALILFRKAIDRSWSARSAVESSYYVVGSGYPSQIQLVAKANDAEKVTPLQSQIFNLAVSAFSDCISDILCPSIDMLCFPDRYSRQLTPKLGVNRSATPVECYSICFLKVVHQQTPELSNVKEFRTAYGMYVQVETSTERTTRVHVRCRYCCLLLS